MKMYPISSRLGSDHTAQTDAAFSFVMLTLVAVAAFLPRVPLSTSSSSPEGFICLGINFRWRFPLIRQKIEMSATVVHIYCKTLNSLIVVFVLDSVHRHQDYIWPHNIKRKLTLGGQLERRRTHSGHYCSEIVRIRPELPWIHTMEKVGINNMILCIFVLQEN